eukprot:COSAG02_NODE_1438_length_12604_cov_27.849580_6_plen_286_part_00
MRARALGAPAAAPAAPRARCNDRASVRGAARARHHAADEGAARGAAAAPGARGGGHNRTTRTIADPVTVKCPSQLPRDRKTRTYKIVHRHFLESHPGESHPDHPAQIDACWVSMGRQREQLLQPLLQEHCQWLSSRAAVAPDVAATRVGGSTSLSAAMVTANMEQIQVKGPGLPDKKADGQHRGFTGGEGNGWLRVVMGHHLLPIFEPTQRCALQKGMTLLIELSDMLLSLNWIGDQSRELGRRIDAYRDWVERSKSPRIGDFLNVCSDPFIFTGKYEAAYSCLQ